MAAAPPPGGPPPGGPPPGGPPPGGPPPGGPPPGGPPPGGPPPGGPPPGGPPPGGPPPGGPPPGGPPPGGPPPGGPPPGGPPPGGPPPGGPPPGGPPVPSPAMSLFTQPDYYNFLKLGKAIKVTATGLTDLADQVMKTYHKSLQGRHGSAVCSRPGGKKISKIKGIKGIKGCWTINCPCGVCDTWMNSIANEFATNQFCWHNADVDFWPVDAWQVAKVYMSGGKATSSNTPQDTDPAGILQLMINCGKFQPFLDIQKVEKVSFHFNDLSLCLQPCFNLIIWITR